MDVLHKGVPHSPCFVGYFTTAGVSMGGGEWCEYSSVNARCPGLFNAKQLSLYAAQDGVWGFRQVIALIVSPCLTSIYSDHRISFVHALHAEAR